MDGGKQFRSSSSSSSSLASELFGSRATKPAASSSTGIFGSIFDPPSKIIGKEFLCSESEKKREFSTKSRSNASGTSIGDGVKSGDGGSKPPPDKETSSIYPEQRVQPCHLSSSIYYGGQENYSHPHNSQGSNTNSTFKKDSGEDDSGAASRGNWWQESLYY
ncbi:hypothetical protein SAY87_023904 [Trapa incisa]|uniref:Uncharacterized protein n=2 Tax=Trapa TaxID=22665 RepID=A0AAN7KIS0_TRANT|nr:hypothetical protein SAY86_014907 [Trapa natans]KAK4775943.1 hypothetical protein SAY87_023904 [Trapa incisa]